MTQEHAHEQPVGICAYIGGLSNFQTRVGEENSQE